MTRIDQDIPSTLDDRYHEGDTAILNITVTEDGSKKDLTDAEAAFALYESVGTEVVLEKDSSSADVTFPTPVDGEIRIQINAGETDGLGSESGETYEYEVAIEDSSGRQATVVESEWTIFTRNTSLP